MQRGRTAWVVGAAGLVLAVFMGGRALAAVKSVSILDNPRRFNPAKIRVQMGDSVQWTNSGNQTHTTTGRVLWDSGNVEVGQSFTFQFDVAGVYHYACALHPDMTGIVSTPAQAVPVQGGQTTVFTITWASGSVPTGYNVDVQISRPGGPGFVGWKVNQTGLSSSFVPDAGVGVYSFRARLQKGTSQRKLTGYSEAVSITVQ